MSMTGSLMGYENNNEVNQAKCKKPLKPLPVVSSVNASGVTTTRTPRRGKRSSKRESCSGGHVNSLWSVWYGILAVAFQAYIATRCAKRFAVFLSLPWPADAPPPKAELHACLVLAGTGVVLLPVLLGAAFLKIGNLANDGIKLGRHLSTCSRDPPSSFLTTEHDNSLANNLWRHGGPTAAFVHLCTAMCFLLPTLLMEARLIHAGFLPKDAIWRTDLDWVVIHRDRLVVLSFMNPAGNLTMLSGLITPQPFITLPPEEDVEDDGLITTPEPTYLTIDSAISKTENTTKYSCPPCNKDSNKTVVPQLKVNFTTNPEPTPPSSMSIITTLKPLTIIKTNTPMTTGKEVTTKASVTLAKRPTTRTVVRNGVLKRSKTKNLLRTSTTAKSIPKNNGNMTIQSLPLVMNSLADLDQADNLNAEPQPPESYGPITLEYLNYAAALMVYSVRYPAVFWSSNKALGTIFSIQLVLNSAQSLLAYAGMSVLYKIQVVGPLKVLPFLRHRTVTTSSTISTIFGDSYFLLNSHITLILFALSSFLVLCSSMVMYLYAHGRFTAFLNQERERRVILPKNRNDGSGWIYFTHCTALCVFLAIAICSAPLLYDYTVVYRGSLDGVILACIIGTVLHLFLWLIFWIFLTMKQRWTFKLRVTIGRATVRSARSVKLVTDVDLLSTRDERDDDDGTGAPLLVVGNGRTYTIAEPSPKNAIMSVIQKAAMERKTRSQGSNADSVDGESNADGDEQIYWLRPKLRPSPAHSPSDAGSAPNTEKSWLNKKLKPKVTFNDLPSTSGSRNKGKARRGIADGGPEDDGDYATLRELPLMTALDPADDSTSEENKINGQTPRCLRRGDSGMPHEELTPDSSNSPPLDTVTTNGHINDVSNGAGSVAGHSNTSSNSETSSSGVHSNTSNNSNVSQSSSQRRATSVDDLTGEPREDQTREQWRSCSLQRGTQPPTANTTFSIPNNIRPTTSQMFSSPQYVNHLPLFVNGNAHEHSSIGCPAIILENPNEATVVIRRKLSKPKLNEPPNLTEEPFGRSTNMRMTSFTESNDVRIQASSATLPHYPTQPVVTYPHCSTMPLPHATSHSMSTNVAGSTGSCGSVPRHTLVPPQMHPNVPLHTTLPSHHNGIRLVHGVPNNPFVKRFPPVHLHTQPWALPGHHTFPQAPIPNNSKFSAAAQIRQSDRDSANFSMASSGDSDTCLPH